MINVRDLISHLQRIENKDLLVVTYNGSGDLPADPKIIHVRLKREDVLKKVGPGNYEAFPAVEL